MPCFVQPTAEEIYAEWEARLRHNSPTADALCELMQMLEGAGIAPTPKAATWWAEHKRRDQDRLAKELAEAAKKDALQTALAKLTPYERSLLSK